MNVYDFDGTIYDGDSGVDFMKYIFFKKPIFMTWHLVKSLKYVFLYQLKRISFQELKEYLFSFVSSLSQLDNLLEEFIEKHKNRMKEYYSQIRKNDDVIISASLDFYLIPLCQKMGFNRVICTKYDVKAGKIIGKNCKNDEKIRRLIEEYGEEVKIENAYGDSKSDIPMLKFAQKGYMIIKNQPVEYQ